jgi:transcriptional regulator with XRE-family HTH domain
MDYGKVFKKQREKMGISQREMAKKLGLTPSALWKIESGRNVPKEGTIVKLCSVAFIPLAYFYKEATTLRDYAYPVSLVGNGSTAMCIDPALPGSEE